jgi:hypothetical protein
VVVNVGNVVGSVIVVFVVVVAAAVVLIVNFVDFDVIIVVVVNHLLLLMLMLLFDSQVMGTIPTIHSMSSSISNPLITDIYRTVRKR